MSYFTLEEAAESLTRRLGGVDVIGSPVTATQMLRFGIHGHLPICVAIDARCYSPTVNARNQQAERLEDPKGWFRDDLSGQKAMDRATVHAIGFFVVPLQTLFAFEARDQVLLEYVESLDGADCYKPFERITRDRLRVMGRHLDEFAGRIQVTAKEASEPKKVWTEAEKEAMRDAIAAGQTQTAVGKKHGISGERVAQLVGKRDPAPPGAHNIFAAKTKRRKSS